MQFVPESDISGDILRDSGILISFDEMYADKRDRHKAPYIRHIFSKMKKRFPYLKDELIERVSLT